MFGHTDAFLNDIGAKLLDRKRTNVACELPNDGIAKTIVVKIQDILDNVVAVRILNERQCVVSDFIHKLDALMVRSMIDAALQHAASVAMSSDLYAVGSHCVVYELVIFRCKLVETFLNNVVPVEILDEHYNMKAECKNDRMNLASGGQEINHFLHCARTVHVQ